MVQVENTRVELSSDSVGVIPVKLIVLPEAAPGEYSGSIILTTGNVNTTIKAVLVIRDPWEEVELSVKSSAFEDKIVPGQALSVLVDIENLIQKKIDLILVTQMIDPESKTVILTREKNFSVTTVASIVNTLLPPESLTRKEYLIINLVYSPRDEGRLKQLGEDSFNIRFGLSLFGSAEFYMRNRTTRSNIQIFLGVLPAVLFVLLGYWRYKVLKDRRRRYLGMVSFDYLPKAGKRSGYMGRVAESTHDAFIELDTLQTHTLCAGATGSGKTIAAQVLIEEALRKKISVIVFDPTGQWTGYLKPCTTRGMIRLYPHFKMKYSEAKSFKGNIHVIDSENERVDIRKYLEPGEITVFSLHNLPPEKIDVFMEKTVKDIFADHPPESSHCRLVIVYDEVHRLLPKFGGSGKALVQIERAVREFRKWGIGLVLVSQVLSDFVGEIKANIGTEIQLRTRYEKDLERINLKYGEEVMHSIVKASVGTGMVQNSEYNQGRPYFVSFRPLLHDPHRLSDEMLGLFGKYNKKIGLLSERIERLAESGVDTFDIGLELNLALDNMRKTSFDVVELYVQGLEENVGKLERKLTNKTLSSDEQAMVSKWEEQGAGELEDYHHLVEGEAEERRDMLVTLEGEIKDRLDSEIARLEKRRGEIKKRLKERITEKEKKKLIKEQSEVIEKEKELGEKLLGDLENLMSEITRTDGMVWRITGDRKLIETRGEQLTDKEKEIRGRIERDVAAIVDEIIERKREIVSSKERANLLEKASNILKKHLLKKAWEQKQSDKKVKQQALYHELSERKSRVYKRGRKGRTDVIHKKDDLLEALTEARGKWTMILENEKLIREKESEIVMKRDKLRKLIAKERSHIETEQKRISEERKKILDSISKQSLEPGLSMPSTEELLKEIEYKEKTIDHDFKHLEDEWKQMDGWLDEARTLDEELKLLRDQWEDQETARLHEEDEIITKREELIHLKDEIDDMIPDKKDQGGSDAR